MFSTCVKTSFFMRLVKTLGQNLGQILPESFYRIFGKVVFPIHYVQPQDLDLLGGSSSFSWTSSEAPPPPPPPPPRLPAAAHSKPGSNKKVECTLCPASASDLVFPRHRVTAPRYPALPQCPPPSGPTLAQTRETGPCKRCWSLCTPAAARRCEQPPAPRAAPALPARN